MYLRNRGEIDRYKASQGRSSVTVLEMMVAAQQLDECCLASRLLPAQVANLNRKSAIQDLWIAKQRLRQDAISLESTYEPLEHRRRGYSLGKADSHIAINTLTACVGTKAVTSIKAKMKRKQTLKSSVTAYNKQLQSL